MKINYKNTELEFHELKIISSNNLFNIIKQIHFNNSQEIIYINPITKIKDLLGTQFFKYVDGYLDKEIINEKFIYELQEKINNEFGNEIVNIAPNNSKILKSIISFEDEFITLQNLKIFLTKILPYYKNVLKVSKE